MEISLPPQFDKALAELDALLSTSGKSPDVLLVGAIAVSQFVPAARMTLDMDSASRIEDEEILGLKKIAGRASGLDGDWLNDRDSSVPLGVT